MTNTIGQSVISFTQDNFSFNDMYLEHALDIADRVSRSSEEQKEFVEAIRQRFATGSQFIILQALVLLDIVVKNSNQFLKLDISSRAFVNSLKKLEKLNNERVNEHLYSLLVNWIDGDEFSDREHDLLKEYVREMQGKRQPVDKPQQSPSDPNKPLRQSVCAIEGASFTRRTSTADEQFVKDMKAAIEMSMADTLKAAAAADRQQPTSGHDVSSKSTNVVIALFDFTDVEPGELSFRANDRITIVDDSQPYWWKGICQGRVGLFPANFVASSTSYADQSMDVAEERDISKNTREPIVDESMLDKCLEMLRSADIAAMPGSDSDELIALEDVCARMAPQIEQEISKLDSNIDKCQVAHEQLLQAIRQYDHECQVEASRILSAATKQQQAR